MHQPDPFFYSFDSNADPNRVTPDSQRSRADDQQQQRQSPRNVAPRRRSKLRKIPTLPPRPPRQNTKKAPAFDINLFGDVNEEKLVADPIAMLRHCIRFFCSNPEVYGNNLQALLDREVMHVMRLKASEVSLVGAQPVAYSVDTGITADGIALPPIAASNNTLGSSAAQTHSDGVFGYGGVSFLPPTQGFLSLLDDASIQASTALTVHLPEAVGWDGTGTGTGMGMGFANEKESMSNVDYMSSEWTPNKNNNVANSSPRFPTTNMNSTIDTIVSSRHALPQTSATMGPSSSFQVVVDGNGYEISYLRSQLQQVEASYNAQSVRLHELTNENTQLITQLETADASAQKWRHAYNAAQGQLDVTRRELDGWRDRATDAAVSAVNHADARRPSYRRKSQSIFNDAKEEIKKLTQLWRETERALQESRRAFENSEKEANQSHDHLSDAFGYIERLERRVARRDRYIDIINTRQQSLEEKYEKLMWCFHEMGTIAGSHSFVDFLLEDDPIWSLVLFIRLQRHVGAFSPALFALTDKEEDACKQGQLMFVPSPGGAKLMDNFFHPSVVYTTMANETTGVDDRRNKGKRLRTNLTGTVGCRVLRWQNHFSVDYLGGEESTPDSCEINRRKLPLLSLASLVLPLRNADGTVRYGRNKPSADGGDPQPVPLLELTTPNSKEFDQATIRFILRCFWGSRVAHYKEDMQRRVNLSIRKCQRQERLVRRTTRLPDSVLSHQGPTTSEEDLSEEEEDLEDNVIPNTFLAALVAFVIKFIQGGPAAMKEALQTGSSTADESLLVVKGILSKQEQGVWDNGRVFFASVLHASSRTYSASGEGTRPPPDITPKSIELLACIYHYTMELRSSDSDFRLFYLVSHQFLPEMVGVNFFAGLEAFQNACHEAHLKELSMKPMNAGELSDADIQAVIFPEDECKDAGGTSALTAIRQVAQVVDRTPLLGEDDNIEDDSDGEGFGSVLPGPSAKAQKDNRLSPSLNNIRPSTRSSRVASPLKGGNSIHTTEPSSPMSRVDQEAQLMHNIRAYIQSVNERRHGATATATAGEETSPVASKPTSASQDGKSPAPPTQPWKRLDQYIKSVLGGHSSMLKEFEDLQGASSKYGESFFSRSRSKRAHFDDVQSKRLAALRGLLPIEVVLRLFHEHCFATYALTCCGSPRFSLAEDLCPPTSSSTKDYLSPFTVIGQLPPLPIHLQRLRFALSLDQPSTLIQFRNLFEFDPRTGTPSHFYDEYLTLTLDVYLQQRTYMMETVLRACAARHERFMAEGAEDCDGNIPISYLRKGLEKAFLTVGLGKSQADAFLGHLRRYDKLLKEEDEIRLEQFADAPFFVNTNASDNDRQSEGDKGFDLKEESETCSLMHIALAVRMTYFIWGRRIHSSAQRLMATYATVAVYGQPAPVLPKDNTRSRPASSVKNKMADDIIEAQKRSFQDSIKILYMQTSQRFARNGLEEASMTSINFLRRTLIVGSISNAPSEGVSPKKQNRGLLNALAYPTAQRLLPPGAARPTHSIAGGQAAKGAKKGKPGAKRSTRKPAAMNVAAASVTSLSSETDAAVRWTSGSSNEALYTLSRVLGLASNGLPSEKKKGGKKKKVASGDDVRGGLDACAVGIVGDLVDRLGECVEKLTKVEAQEAAQRKALVDDHSDGSRSSLSPRLAEGRKGVAFAADRATPSADRRPSLEWTPVFSNAPAGSGSDPLTQRSDTPSAPHQNGLCVSGIYASCAALSLI